MSGKQKPPDYSNSSVHRQSRRSVNTRAHLSSIPTSSSLSSQHSAFSFDHRTCLRAESRIGGPIGSPCPCPCSCGGGGGLDGAGGTTFVTGMFPSMFFFSLSSGGGGGVDSGIVSGGGAGGTTFATTIFPVGVEVTHLSFLFFRKDYI